MLCLVAAKAAQSDATFASVGSLGSEVSDPRLASIPNYQQAMPSTYPRQGRIIPKPQVNPVKIKLQSAVDMKEVTRPPDYWAECTSDDVDRAIRGCNVIIIGNLPTDDIGLAYSRRGIAYNKKGLYQLAIDDFGSALNLDPNLEGVVLEREKALYNASATVRQ